MFLVKKSFYRYVFYDFDDDFWVDCPDDCPANCTADFPNDCYDDCCDAQNGMLNIYFCGIEVKSGLCSSILIFQLFFLV